MGPARIIMGTGRCSFPLMRNCSDRVSPRISWLKKTSEKANQVYLLQRATLLGSCMCQATRPPYRATRTTSTHPKPGAKRSRSNMGLSTLACTKARRMKVNRKEARGNPGFLTTIRPG
jgi:hypothetical protein